MKLRKLGLVSVFVASGAFLTGCDPVTIAVGGTALAGSTMVGNEEGVTGSISDTNLQTKINAALMDASNEYMKRVELCVKHGMVIVIGYMQSEDQRIRVMNIVRNVKFALL